MHRFLLVVTIVSSLAATVGCGARPARHSAVPAAMAVADIATNDPSYCPPGEEFSFEGSVRETPRTREASGTEMKPNAPEKPTHGAVHAAVY